MTHKLTLCFFATLWLISGCASPVEYVVFDDEGHGFSKKKNQLIGHKASLQFLDKHLKNN